jgi:hypothetical protein
MIFAVIPWQIEPGPRGMMPPSLMPTLMMVLVTGLSLLLVIVNLRDRAKGPEEFSASPVSRSELAALGKIGGVFAISIGLYLQVSPLAAGRR